MLGLSKRESPGQGAELPRQEKNLEEKFTLENIKKNKYLIIRLKSGGEVTLPLTSKELERDQLVGALRNGASYIDDNGYTHHIPALDVAEVIEVPASKEEAAALAKTRNPKYQSIYTPPREEIN